MQYRAGNVFSGKPSFDNETQKEGKPRLVTNEIDPSENEVYYDKDIIVLANPEMAGLPKWVIALVMAGCVAAALSTAAGLLLVLSTSISHDLMKKIIKPDITDKQEIRYARIASFGALLIAAYFGINPPSSFVAKTVAFAFGLAASSFFPTLIMGIFSKKINKQGAIAGMISGISFTLGYIIYFQFLTESKNYWFGISPEGIGFLGMFINFIVAFVVSSITPPPPKEVQQMIDEIRIPKGAGEASEH
jgi:cation/acetate symporter